MIGIILVLITVLVLGVLSNAFNVLVVASIITLLAYKWRDMFQKAHWYYIGALVIATLASVFYQESWTFLVTKGIIGYGFIVVVMFVGVLPNKWTVTRNVKKNRGVFSIMGFILIAPHALLRVFGLMGFLNLFGLAAFVIMLPLTIISFRVIRKQIKPKDWFRIQKAAYVIYLLLFIHLYMVSFVVVDKVVYAVIAALYINNKLIKEFSK
jgi:DMSO/TMAO reductase YedYZ heme-binding membrane subunit